jgi:hypothetical protein
MFIQYLLIFVSYMLSFFSFSCLGVEPDDIQMKQFASSKFSDSRQNVNKDFPWQHFFDEIIIN